ncbi:unnamed protein product [Linum tenue]|uniref:Uncharacterized protein n=1 Tax=Linum tenue TaxID=586396 RepID=A0AAV0LFA2_9ROSI|nr:unnamed protein product [Linum tenue]
MSVIEREHSFSSGKEVCKCVFAVVWQKGPWNGYVWHKSIEDIRIVESGSELDPDVTRFFNMARKEIAASGSASKAKNGVDDHQPANGTRSVEEDDWEDADFGRRNDRYALLVDNLEKDISSSTLKQFIHQETSLGVEVHVSSRLFPETLNKAVIVVESEQQLDELYKFLDCPAQIVVTRTGRPLVVTEKKFEFDTLAMMRMEGLIDMGRGSYMQQGGGIGVKHGLKVVRKGSVEFEEAKEMKDLFVEFSHHQRGLLKKQVEKEKEIMEAGNA